MDMYKKHYAVVYKNTSIQHESHPSQHTGGGESDLNQ